MRRLQMEKFIQDLRQILERSRRSLEPTETVDVVDQHIDRCQARVEHQKVVVAKFRDGGRDIQQAERLLIDLLELKGLLERLRRSMRDPSN